MLSQTALQCLINLITALAVFPLPHFSGNPTTTPTFQCCLGNPDPYPITEIVTPCLFAPMIVFVIPTSPMLWLSLHLSSHVPLLPWQPHHRFYHFASLLEWLHWQFPFSYCFGSRSTLIPTLPLFCGNQIPQTPTLCLAFLSCGLLQLQFPHGFGIPFTQGASKLPWQTQFHASSPFLQNCIHYQVKVKHIKTKLVEMNRLVDRAILE